MRFPVLTLCLILFGGSASAGPVDYLRDVKPILQAKCATCHGALQQKGKLRLDTAALARKGGKSGPAFVPGKGSESLLIEAVLGNSRPRMPPEKDGELLTQQQIATLRSWIDQGANAPAEAVPEDPRGHWSFRTVVRPPVPKITDPVWCDNPVDAFVAAEHARRGLLPRTGTDRDTLLRRVTLDLTGLPPTREELHAFRADPSPDAYEKVVERLLASPRHGERWGRHWMDVWRYSDWYGRRSVPDWWNSASQIWRWRDWIVRSLNEDKGYDRMVREMLAADEIAPEDDANLVATGYLARNWYALNYNQWMRDIVEHTGKAFLGLTFNCCHCHDHKYDPISQEEYFRFRAFFEPLELRQDRVPGEADPGPFQKYSYSVLRKPVRTGSIRVMDERPDAKTYMYHLGDERDRMKDKPPVAPGMPAFLGGQLTITPIALPPAAYYPGLKPFIQQEETVKHEQAVAAAKTACEKAEARVTAARQQAASLNNPTADARLAAQTELASALEDLLAAKAHLLTAKADLLCLHARIKADKAAYKQSVGDAGELAVAAAHAERLAAREAAEVKVVQAELAWFVAKNKPQDDKAAAALKQAEQQLTAARAARAAAEKAMAEKTDKYTPFSPIYPATSTGRRRALAQWMTDKANPLTARVAVNHIWLRHFGKPLVESVFDFGRNGKKPSHPELLDWLAAEFMESGWSMKHLHRRIVTSQSYRLRSGPDPASVSMASDPDNRWLWHFPRRQLEAEAVRDSVLFVAGELDLTRGGQELENEAEATSRRRSLYFCIHPEVAGHMQFLELFDAPDPCDCYRRSETLVPQQALALTNSRLLLDQSRLLARKLSQPPCNDDDFLTAAFERVLSRRPTTAEITTCKEFLGRQADLFRGAKTQVAVKGAGVAPSADPTLRARESLVRALFSHDDFVTMR